MAFPNNSKPLDSNHLSDEFVELDELGASVAVLCACVAVRERTCCISAILRAWENGDYHAENLAAHQGKLEQVRLQFGPEWLKCFLSRSGAPA